MISAFAVGTGALALEMFVRNPIQALACVRRGDEGGFMAGLMHIASMTDAQRLMMGIVATIGLIWVQRGKVRHNRLWFVLLAVQCVALTMTFKRGSWVCAIIAVVLFALLTANWKYVFALTLILSLAAGLAPVRSRVASLKNEFKDDNGGRMTMWFKIAPALIKEYPWGVGFGSVTPEMMRKIAPKVEPNRNHLHSNIFEVLVETGWLGLAVYILWMLWAFCDATIFAWAARRAPPEEMVGAFVVLLMLIGLLANGLVEYNFAEAQLVIPCGYLIGMAAAGRRFSGMRNVQSAHLNP
jgi:O-antigen ligase